MSAISEHIPEKVKPTEATSEVETFVSVNEAYYLSQFQAIGDKRGFLFTWNWAAFLLGSIWYGMRSLWANFLPLVALETMAVVQLARGIWGDLGAPILARLPGIEATLERRYEQLADAQENAPDRVAGFPRAGGSHRTGTENRTGMVRICGRGGPAVPIDRLLFDRLPASVSAARPLDGERAWPANL